MGSGKGTWRYSAATMHHQGNRMVHSHPPRVKEQLMLSSAFIFSEARIWFTASLLWLRIWGGGHRQNGPHVESTGVIVGRTIDTA
jgi:hypothetical protein